MEIYNPRQVAEFLDVRVWRVRRLFEDGTLSEPQRFAGERAIPQSLIPPIVDPLCRRGWPPEAISTRTKIPLTPQFDTVRPIPVGRLVSRSLRVTDELGGPVLVSVTATTQAASRGQRFT